MLAMLTERLFRRALIVIALGGLIIGLIAWGVGRNELAWWAWAAGTVPVVQACSSRWSATSWRAAWGSTHRVRLDVRRACARRKFGGGRRCRHVCRRQCARGLCRRPRRARPEVLGRSRSQNCPSPARIRQSRISPLSKWPSVTSFSCALARSFPSTGSSSARAP